ncbi:MAG: YbjN domain-containing protein [Acidobacteria bacterium]|nr:MAG: YbjN domain-containing protein [Acidobacteriota bacterium]
MVARLTPEQSRVLAVLEGYLREQYEELDSVVAVEPDGANRWMIRLTGQTKDFTTIWFTVGDRTLQYESYFMPDPEENHEELYRYLLFKNANMYSSRFSLADDHDIFITGQLPLAAVDADEIDRVVGTIYANVESYFGRAIRIGYASRFASNEQEDEAGPIPGSL